MFLDIYIYTCFRLFKLTSRLTFWGSHWKGPSLKYGTDKSLPGNKQTDGLLPRLLGADSHQQERRVGYACNLVLG